tara:strand:+ start:745 stop:1035 length:291 start_codon:yes stop_codon:yes gene_type:complete
MTNKEAFESLNLKDGDKATIHRKCEGREKGWNNTWIPGMDEFVGKEVTISLICENTQQYYIREQGSAYPALAFIPPIDPEKRKKILDKIRGINQKK